MADACDAGTRNAPRRMDGIPAAGTGRRDRVQRPPGKSALSGRARTALCARQALPSRQGAGRCRYDRHREGVVRHATRPRRSVGLNEAWIEPERIVELNEAPERPGDYVLYWMQQSQRAQFNPALEMAVAQANRLALPVVVGFGLTDGYPEANARHYTFMLEGLAETAEAIDARGLRFVIRRGGPDDVAIALAQRAALVVCDRGYLRPQRAWRTRVAAEAGRRLVQVEGDVVVPVGAASAKHEIAARTLRPKLARRRDEFLTPLAKERVSVRADSLDVRSDLDLGDIPALVRALCIDHGVAAVTGLRGGYREARRHLRGFVTRHLERYVMDRAHPGHPHVSTLAPSLHLGQISPVEIALTVRDASVDATNRDTYLEELLVRRELSMNFVNTT